MRPWSITPALVVGLLAAALPVAGQAPSPGDLAASLQKRYATIRDFRADFSQTMQGGVLRAVQSEQRGQVRVKKPGRMWWAYSAPHRQSLVADGAQLYYYNASDRTGTRSPMPTGDNLSTAVLFLTGRGDLQRDFTASMPTTHPDGEWHLRLTPRVRQDDFATLTLYVDRASLAFKGLSTVDHQGGTSIIRFSNLRENAGLTDSEFVFTFPRGTHVVSSGRAR